MGMGGMGWGQGGIGLVILLLYCYRMRVVYLILITWVCFGIDPNIDWKPVDNIIAQKISEGHFTGCVLGIYTSNSTILKKSYGTLFPKYDLYAPPVTPQTIFDLNFITQVIGTNSALMSLHDQNKLRVTDHVSKHLSEFDNNGKRNITIANLMLHNSGLQATIDHQPFAPNPAELIKKINGLKLEYKEDTKFVYSQLGYVVLGEMIAKVNKKGLNQSLYQILLLSGLRETEFLPKAAPHLIAPSGFHDGVSIRGTPGDRIANFLGGVAGNAGLFSIIDNLGSFMQLMLNRGKKRLELRIFSEQVVNLFTTKVQNKHYQNTRALGWDTVPLVNPPCGKKFSANSFGFSDPKGSYLWADKDKNITIILLAAGGYPTNSATNHYKAQGQISDEIMTLLGY